jgi:hypothetical protein
MDLSQMRYHTVVTSAVVRRMGMVQSNTRNLTSCALIVPARKNHFHDGTITQWHRTTSNSSFSHEENHRLRPVQDRTSHNHVIVCHVGGSQRFHVRTFVAALLPVSQKKTKQFSSKAEASDGADDEKKEERKASFDVIAKRQKEEMQEMLPDGDELNQETKTKETADREKLALSSDATVIGTPQLGEAAKQQQKQLEDMAFFDENDEYKDHDFYFPRPQGLVLSSDDVVWECKDGRHAIYRSSDDGIIAIHCSLGWIVRHGPSDGIVEVNVGGKSFHTLRSTIVSSRVLSELYANAKLYQRHDTDMLFIDRDAATFHIILTYLRNRLEDLSHASHFMKTPSSLKKYMKSEHFVTLPKDNKILRDVYLEARFFGLNDFKDEICGNSLVVKFSSFLSGGNNPFDQLSDAIKNARRVAVSSSLLLGGHVSTGGQVPELLQPVLDNLTKIFPG